MSLDRQTHQGEYGEAFVHVLAKAAGLQCDKRSPDRSGVDFAVGYPGEHGTVRYPQIEIQVKSWSRWPRDDDHEWWDYDGLSETQFNALAGLLQVPRYLVLVLVPDDPWEFTDADHFALHLAHAAYWVSFVDEPLIASPSKTKRRQVRVPKNNLLTVRSLLTLLSPALVEAS